MTKNRGLCWYFLTTVIQLLGLDSIHKIDLFKEGYQWFSFPYQKTQK